MWRCVCHWVSKPGFFTFQNKIVTSTSGSEGPDTHRTNCLQTPAHMCSLPRLTSKSSAGSRLRLKCDSTRTVKQHFVCSAKRTNQFKSAGGRQFSRLLAAEMCASVVIMLDAPCSEVVWRVLISHCIRELPTSLPLPCVTVCHRISTGFYTYHPDEGSVYFER